MIVRSLELLLNEHDTPKEYVNPKTGYRTKLYRVGVLARSIGRSVETLRQWEVSHKIPRTPFKDKKTGHIYYCEEQIRLAINCAERAGICNGKMMCHTNFTKWVQESWDALFEEIFVTGRKEEVDIEHEAEYYHKKVLKRRRLKRQQAKSPNGG